MVDVVDVSRLGLVAVEDEAVMMTSGGEIVVTGELVEMICTG